MLGRQRFVVVGVGINISEPPPLPEVDPALPAPMQPAWMQELDPAATAPSVLGQIAQPLALALHQFGQHGFAPWVSRFQVRDALAGQEVWLSDGTQGRAVGVSASGALQVRTEYGLRDVLSDEVSVRPLARG
jgi:BirA family biotin operon repressor/biotin-[acetyl-CoA-carboxylase] ligase